MSQPAASTPPSEAAGRPDRPVRVSGEIRLDQIFTQAEIDLVEDLRAFASGGAEPRAKDVERAVEGGIYTLATMALSLSSYPSLKDRHVLGGKERSFETLMRTLLEGGEHGLEWVLPSKAILSRAFGIAKVNFFTGLRYVIEACEGADARALLHRILGAIEESVYMRLAEELYASFITSRTMAREVKAKAAQHLIDLWEGRSGVVTSRFCPILRSAWAARTRAPRIFGTLMGTSEIFQLLFQDCDEQFVSWFTRYGQDSEQVQAFEEFLFDLSFENLQRVRQRMREEGRTCVGPREVEIYLAFGEGNLRPLTGDPKGLYVSFRRRRVKAQYRTSVGVAGPKKTAEAYMLEAIFAAESESARGAPRPPG
jgi:hypothetical protein